MPYINRRKNIPRELFREIEKATYKMLLLSVLLGMVHVKEKEEGELFFADDWDVSFTEAVEYFKEKLVLTPEEFKTLDAKARFRAFTVAKLTGLDAIERVKEKLAKAIEKGLTLKEWIEKMGEDGILKIVGFHQSNPWYLETVFRTNIQSAYNAGRLMQFERSKDKIKLLEYVAVEDSRTTQICRRLDGTRLPPDDPFWSIYTPPNHFRCRSSVRAIFKHSGEGKKVRAWKPKELPDLPEGFASSPAEKWWKVVESMKKRLEKYGVAEEVKKKVQPLAIRDKEKEIVNLPKEKAVVFDDWGEVIFEKGGTKSEVKFTMEEVKLFKGKVLTHNHPSGGSLSLQDIKFLVETKVKEIRAVGRGNNYVYKAWIIRNPSMEEFEEFRKFYEYNHKNFSSSLYQKALAVYNKFLEMGFSEEEAGRLTHQIHTHWIMEEASKKFDWLNYERGNLK